MDKKTAIIAFINEMKRIEESILQFLEDVTTDGIDQSNFRHFLDDLNIKDDKNKLKEFLRLLSNISNNHHQFKGLFNKVEQIMTFYLEDIKRFFSETEIFQIFCQNKRILLFLFETKTLIPNKNMYYFFRNGKTIDENNDLKYFYIEFKPFIDEEKAIIQKIQERKFRVKITMTENNIIDDLELFKKKRRIGEIDNHLCEIIRDDLIDDFIQYVNQYKVTYSKHIETSIYETNPFLFKKKINFNT